MSDTGAGRRRIAVVADDLIWATRLADGVRRAGAEPVPLRTAAAVDVELARPVVADGAIVDLSARAYAPLVVLRAATAAGVPAIAVGPHDDAALRQAARDAGAVRVHPYRVVFERGDEVLRAWLGGLGSDAASPAPATAGSDPAPAPAAAVAEPR